MVDTRDKAFANMPDNKTACIDNPKIYVFADPVDTPEMGLFFDTIVHDNIVKPMQDAVDRITKLRKTESTGRILLSRKALFYLRPRRPEDLCV